MRDSRSGVEVAMKLIRLKSAGSIGRKVDILSCLMLSLMISLTAITGQAQSDESVIRVARVSLIEGEVSYQRASDSRTDWYDASLNMPLDTSDQLFSGPNGRAEIQLSGRNIVRIDRDSNLRFTQFNLSTIQLALPIGTATFRIDSLDRRQFQILDARDPNQDDPVYFEVDTPTVAIVFLKEGNYRVNVRDDGTTEVIVRKGKAEIYNKELGSVTVNQGRRMIVEARDNYYQITKQEDKDGWDSWNDRRDDELFARLDSYRSSQYIPAALPGVYDLDIYGDWVQSPDYGWIWAPRAVPIGWAPYRQGNWRWYPSYGWTWVSYEPWGWVPYHYGRWAHWRNRWYWVPSVSYGVGIGYGWNWSPHLVTFFGWGGSRYNRGYRDGFNDGYRAGVRDGWLGWCPLAPGEQYSGRGSRAGNNNNPPRSLTSYRNYNAPGGFSGMEGRKFDQGRVIVSNDVLTAPPRQVAGRQVETNPVLLASDELKPTTSAPVRNTLIERGEVARRIEAPVVMRRQATDSGTPARTVEGSRQAPSRSVQDGVVVPPTQDRKTDTRISDGVIQRSDRPTRNTDYRTVVPATPPDWTTPRPSRDTDVRSGNSRESTAPGRTVDRPTRVETPSRPEMPSRSQPARQAETPSRPGVERREAPREMPRETRRPDPPPSRESMPSRPVERPSAPPAQRPSSPPPSNTERPSTPSRGSSPEKRPERPAMPERKPNS